MDASKKGHASVDGKPTNGSDNNPTNNQPIARVAKAINRSPDTFNQAFHEACVIAASRTSKRTEVLNYFL